MWGRALAIVKKEFGDVPFSVLKCKKLFYHLRLPLYFVVPICVSEETILKYEGRGIPVSIFAWLLLLRRQFN